MSVCSSPTTRRRAMRLASFVLAALMLGGCGSINIPLGSMLGSKSTPATTSDASLTSTPAPVAAVSSEKLPVASSESTGSIKTASAAASSGKPFTLDAESDITGSIGDGTPQNFSKSDQDAVVAVLGNALPEKGSAVSSPWNNGTTGISGMVVPLANLGKPENPSCRDLLISYGKDTHKEWYKAEACRKASKWQLSDVSPWRKTR